VRMFGDHLRYYVMTGPDLLDIRKDYLALTGTPPAQSSYQRSNGACDPASKAMLLPTWKVSGEKAG
jgi:hypothetical protein